MKGAFQLFAKYFLILLLFFLIFQIGRLYFLIYNLDLLPDGFWLTCGQSAWSGLQLDFSASAYCTSLFLVVGILEILLKRRLLGFQKVLLVVVMTIVLLITIADPELFQKWGNKFNSQVLVYISHPVEMALSAGATNWLKTLLFAAVFCFILYKLYQLAIRILKIELSLKWINLGPLLILNGINFIIIRGGVGVATISQSSAIYSNKSIENAAAINSLWNAMYFISTNTDAIYGTHLNYLSDSESERLFEEQLNQTFDSAKVFTIQHPNVIIVMLESFTANASRYFSGNNNHTPFLDSIAQQNLSFMRCYASGDRTEKGLVSVLSGYPAQPSSSIIVFPDKVSKMPSLSKALRKQGYKNYFFYGGDAEFASMKAYLVVQNFDKIFDKLSFNSAALTSKWGAHDEHLFRLVLDKLKKEKGPFFSTVMTLSSHEPFDVPSDNSKIPKDEWYGFKNSIEYADKCLFDFLENCKKQAWYNETIIVLIADHGHDIGLKNVHYFGPEKYHIPFVVAGGALNKKYKGIQIMNVVSQTILPQFILSQMGIASTEFSWQTNFENKQGFAQYHYNNGFGRVTNSQQALFDNDTRKCYEYQGSETDSLRFINEAKAFQQVLIKDFLSK